MITRVKSENYNRIFDTKTGMFARWGKTIDDDPEMCPIGPELIDIEISTICHGFGKTMETRKPCTWCYKSNTEIGENMSFETFKGIFEKFPKTLTQIAFGIGDVDSNKDLWKIMQLCRDNNVVPNLTTSGMGVEGEIAQKLANICGGVSVSHYTDDSCFNAVKNLTDAGLGQVNIHKLLSAETFESCFKLIDSAKNDSRLSKMKAIIFLLLKPKGKRNQLTPIRRMSDYKRLMDYARDQNIAVGMDSCSAPMALKTLPTECVQSIEPCESTLFSIYIDVKGKVFPCSFTPGRPGWDNGIDAVGIKSFNEIWYHPRLVSWRESLLKSSRSKGCTTCGSQKHCRSCPIYDISICNPKPHLGYSELVQIGNVL